MFFTTCFSLYIQQFTKEYTFVGWGDIDTIYNDFDLLSGYLNDYDVVTVGLNDLNRLYLRGQLTLFKNTESLVKAFTDPIPLAFMIM